MDPITSARNHRLPPHVDRRDDGHKHLFSCVGEFYEQHAEWRDGQYWTTEAALEQVLRRHAERQLLIDWYQSERSQLPIGRTYTDVAALEQRAIDAGILKALALGSGIEEAALKFVSRRSPRSRPEEEDSRTHVERLEHVEADPLEWHQVVSRVAPPSRPLLSGRLSPPEPPVDFTPLKALLVSILKQSVLGTLVVEVITQEPELRYILELLKDYLAEISTDARQRFLVFIIRLFSGSYRDREIIAAMSAELKVLIGSKTKYFFKQPYESRTGAPGDGGDEEELLDKDGWTATHIAPRVAKAARQRTLREGFSRAQSVAHQRPQMVRGSSFKLTRIC
jgi:hypothetical protein